MLVNYIKIAFRQLWKNKFYSSINILGLTIGLASCLLIVLYVLDELSYDRFHKNKDRIYRITEEFKTGEGVTTTALTPYKLALDLQRQFPQIEKVVRIDYDIQQYTVQYGDKKFNEKSITASDSTFFNVFSFTLLQGDTKTVLTEPNTVAISDKIAEKYFGNSNGIGKVLSFIEPYNYTTFQAKVTGVFKAMPGNSHFHKDFIFSMATADKIIPERKEDLGWTSMFSYLLLSPSADPKTLEKNINDYIFKNYPKEVLSWWSKFYLQSLNDIHLRSNLKEELEPNGDIKYVYIFSAIALFLILLAAVNYMNLATARAANRAREVGVRKVSGALKQQIIYQFLSESVIMTLIALVLAYALITASLPFFNTLSGKNLSINFFHPELLIAVLAVTLLVGIFSGSYPAFYLSAFQPIKVLKGPLANTGKGSLLLRRGLVILQFSVSIILIIGTIIIYDQWKYLQSKKLGINSSQVLLIPTQTEKLQKQYKTFKTELLKQPGIINVTASRKDFTSRFASYTTVQVEGQEKGKTIPWNAVDANFFKCFNIPIVGGSDFFTPAKSDSVGQFILNESAVQQLGLKSPVGTRISALGDKGEIIGVVKDFHFESLHTPISPVIFSGAPRMNYVAIKIKSAGLQATVQRIKQVYTQIDAGANFEYTFLDDKIVAQYKTEARFFKVFTTFSALAIIIACLGIFGLASFSASQRTKEIGIRKVLGASVQHISLLLIKEFIKLVIIANIIATPTAWYVMQQWLQDFPYRTEIQGWMFIVAAVTAICIAVLTVSAQAIKAAITNPVRALRSE
jgi:putative ABC transport system permease protein